MADDEVATKAPESDQHSSEKQPSISHTTLRANNDSLDKSTTHGDMPAQSASTMGEHCTTDRPLPSDASGSSPQPLGEMTTLNGISAYVSKPDSYPHNPGRLLLLLTGGTGLHSINNQLQADAYAARGFLVVMPDQFGGDAAPNTSHIDGFETAQPSLIDRVKMGVADTAKSFVIDMWLARQTPEKVMPIVRKALEGARETYADAVANGGGMYGVGYCNGAKYVLLLSGEKQEGEAEGKDEEKGEILAKGPELKAGAIAHGTMITKDDIEGVKCPIAMVCVADDSLFPDEVREQGRAALELNAVEHDIKVFGGVPHGFAVVGDYKDPTIQERQSEAFEMMSGWIESH